MPNQIASIASFVTITPRDNKVDVRWGFNILSKKTSGGKYICYIPGFDLYYGASDKDEAARKSSVISKMFLDHFVLHSNTRSGFKALVMQLHKLGFKANNDALTLKEIAKNNIVNAKFKTNNIDIPDEFHEAERTAHESHMEVAI